MLSVGNKKPAEAGYGSDMDYIDFMWLKFFVFVLIAFLVGFYKSFTGRQ